MMRLVHYSNAPFGELQEFGPPPEDDWRSSFYKPSGLWVSDDDTNYGWREWCIDNDFMLDCLTHIHDVTLAADANVRIVRTPKELDRLTAEFRLPGRRDNMLDEAKERFVRVYGLLWRNVRERYDGLIVTPYLWDRRLDINTMWYYAWDCASGCLWRKRAIESVILREVVEAPRRKDRE